MLDYRGVQLQRRHIGEVSLCGDVGCLNAIVYSQIILVMSFFLVSQTRYEEHSISNYERFVPVLL